MLRIFIAAAYCLCIAGAYAQQSPSGSVITPGKNHEIPCDSLPAPAVRDIPAPFDRYMRLFCNSLTGEGLRAADGFHWMGPNGIGIDLSSTMQVGSSDTKAGVSFPFSWYTKLAPLPLSALQQDALRADFKDAIRPPFLKGSTILEVEVTTSNGENKNIVLIVPDAQSARPKWLLGLECNGTCFREDTEPMMFIGEPNPN